MAFDQKTRNLLARTIGACRDILAGPWNRPQEGEFPRQLQQVFGVNPDGTAAPLEALSHLPDEDLQVARLLRGRLTHLAAGLESQGKPANESRKEAVARLARDQAFTVINRLAALRMAEEREIVLECVRRGIHSEGFELFLQGAGTALGDRHHAYRAYLLVLFDELALDLGALFNRWDPAGLLFPRPEALEAVLKELDGVGRSNRDGEFSPDQFAEVWKADETIGWIYQYYNDAEERKKMREESSAPRNSRELAVRNQFFTPRYVVEFLNDNTLGRIWYEMTQGQTRLKEQCRYLVRRPNEIFLGPDQVAVTPLPFSQSLDSIIGDPREAHAKIFLQEDLSAYEPPIGWYQEAFEGNFENLPENADDLWTRWVGAAIPPHQIDAIIGEKWEPFESDTKLSRLTQSIYDGKPDPETRKLPVTWAILSASARTSQLAGGFERPNWRKLWSYFRQLAQTWQRFGAMDESKLSQEELLRQPVFVPHRPIKDPREIRLLDPACGSMHFGLYAFDLFEVIYGEAWDIAKSGSIPPSADKSFSDFCLLTSDFSSKEEFLPQVPRLIIEQNLHGIDIDPRCVQIGGLSLWLRAQRAWHKAGLKPTDRPRITRSNLVCAEPMPGEKELLREFVESAFPPGEQPAFNSLLETVFDRMTLAGEAGSLLRIEQEIRAAISEAKRLWKEGPKHEQATLFHEAGATLGRGEMRLDLSGITDEQFWDRAEQRIYDALEAYAEQAENGGGFQRRLFANDTAQGFAFIHVCRKRYDVAVMNPPFGDASLPSKNYIDETYGDTKGDVYKAFVECFHDRLLPAGYLGIISSRTGFFLGQSEDWRTRVVLRLFRPIALADLGMGVLDAMVEVAAYILRNLSESEARDLTLSLVPVLAKVERDRQDRFSLPRWQAARGGLKRHQAVAELEHLEAHGFVQRSSGDTIRYTPLWHLVKKVIASPAAVFPPLVCVRALGDTAKGEAVFEALFNPHDPRRFVINPGSFICLPGTTFAYWASPRLLQTFTGTPSLQNSGFEAWVGLQTNQDFRWLRLMWELCESACPAPANRGETRCWLPFAKGGEYSPFYSDIHLAVLWGTDGLLLKEWKKEELRRGRITENNSQCWNESHYRRPGLTWPRRSQIGLSVRVMPAGCLFGDKGPGIFIDDASPTRLLAALGIANSAPFKRLVALQMAFGSFEVGVLRRTPYPRLSHESESTLGLAARKVWEEKRWLDTIESTSNAFFRPALLATPCGTIAESAAAWAARVRTSEETVAATQAEIDEFAFRLYGLDAADRDALTATLDTEATSDTETEGDEDEDQETATPDAPALVADLLAYALGTILGRWDIRYGTGERPAPELPDPFAPLPVCPPGMLQGDDGLPLSPEEGRRQRAEGRYPLDVAWDGILVDDPEHPLDLERRVHAALAVLWGDRADALEHEACALLGVPTLREWFRRPAGFFADHLKRYSKSRRQAPIYWPLSTASGSYTLWIYYHRLTPDTLYKCLQQFVEPKLKDVEQQVNGLRTRLSANDAGSRERRQLEEAESLFNELREMHADLTYWAPRWKPNLNDGVLITACPVWKLFRLPRWRRDLEACWQKLSTGDYDWAHLALSLWPDRVREKCRMDRSLAIAHGLEDLCQIAAPTPKKKGASKNKASSQTGFELADETEP